MAEETALFAMGCFWEPDDFFSQLKGVKQTTVGYSGGAKENPEYYDLGDHTETTEIVFDPNIISFEQLLKHFWTKHDPTAPQKTQYKSAVFYTTEAQKKETQRTLKIQQEKYSDKILTEIVPAKKFWKAEEYHQKYLKKHSVQRKIMGLFGN